MKNIAEQSIKLNSSLGSQNRHTRRTLNRPAVQKLRKRMTIRLCRSVNREGPSQPLPPKVRRAAWGRWGGRIRTRLAPPAHVRVAHRAAPRQTRHRATGSNSGAGSGSGSGNDGDGGDGEPPHHPLVLTYEDLATLLHVAVGTLKNRYSRDPSGLPPAILIPGCRGPRWLLATVLRWLEAHEAMPPANPAPKRRGRVGRPRIAQAGKGGASC